MVTDKKPSQAMSNDDIDDILDLVDVVEVGKSVPEGTSDVEAEFSADLDTMLNDLEEQEAGNTPFPDPTPVDYEVDPNESLDLPSMDDLDNLLAELGAEKPAEKILADDEKAAGDDLDSAIDLPEGDAKASITAALDQALSNFEEEAVEESVAGSVEATAKAPAAEEGIAPSETSAEEAIMASAEETATPPIEDPAFTALNDAIESADDMDVNQAIEDMLAAASDTVEAPAGDSPAPQATADIDRETAEMVHPDDVYLDIASQGETTPKAPTKEAERDDLPIDIEGLLDAAALSRAEETSPAADTLHAEQAEVASALTDPVEEAPEQSETVVAESTEADLIEPTEAVSEPAPVVTAVAETRLDEDLDGLDAVLDDILVAGSVARECKVDSGATDISADELHDIYERLDNLEGATTSQQLFDRCSALEASLAQKEDELTAVQESVSSLQESLVAKETVLSSMEIAAQAQAERMAELEVLVATQQDHMSDLDSNMEKLVAAAAAKVIREEIAALIASMQGEE